MDRFLTVHLQSASTVNLCFDLSVGPSRAILAVPSLAGVVECETTKMEWFERARTSKARAAVDSSQIS